MRKERRSSRVEMTEDYLKRLEQRQQRDIFDYLESKLTKKKKKEGGVLSAKISY